MIGFRINKAKSTFFDSRLVRRATDKAERRNLSRFGAFVRTASRSSIRKRKRVSRPGQPPSSHVGLLKRLIVFGYDPRRRSVVVGPIRSGGKSGDAPEALEHSGTVVIKDPRTGKQRRARIEARPFMGPALKKEEPKLAPLWRASVK